MSSTCLNEFSENEDVIRAEPSLPHQLLAQSGLRAGASPEKRTDGDQGCPNPCGRDDGPVDCKTMSVRRRLAEDLGCCGCTNKPETPCLVTEDTSTCCQQRRPEPNANAACVDPVEQIINEGLQQQHKKRHSRRRSSCSSRPARPNGQECRSRPPATDRRSSYQPDYFDDQADMDNWREHRDQSRQHPSSQSPRRRSLAFEPFVDSEPYSPARPSTPGAAPTRPPPPPQNENQDVRQEMLLELQRLDEQRAHLLECMERERKIVEMVLEYKRQKRACPAAAEAVDPRDDRERIQRRINEAKRKTAEVQRRLQQSGAHQCGTDEVPACSPAVARCPTPSSSAARCPTPSPSPRNPTPTCSAAAGPETSTSCQRRRLRYQPPSPDTDTEDESCAPPPPRRRLLKYRPPSPDSSSEDAEGNECGRRPSAANADDRQSSLQDSFTYYNRSVRNGVPPVTADVPQQTSSPWTSR